MVIYQYISRKLLLRCLFPLMAVALITHIASASQLRVATFNIGATFGDTYFIYSLGDPGTADHETVRQVLDRIDADVVALQEIHSVDLQGSPDDLDQLASSLGYDFVSVPPVTGVFDTSLRVVFLSRFPILQSTSIASPDGAKEITRRHAAIRVDVPGTDQDPWLISPHMKAGTTSADRFRRAIEMRRLVDFIEGDVTLDDAPWVVLGDFNPSAISSVFDEAPSGLPSTYLMGTDLSFPIRYHVNPIDYFSSPVFRLDPRQLNGSAATYQSSGEGPTLDLILVSQGIAAFNYGAEVYNSAIDFDNLSGLQKRGTPLDSAVSATASDHYAVFADLLLPSISTYQILQSGQAIVEDFSRISGLATPEPWSVSGNDTWIGTDDGSQRSAGWRSYRSTQQRALGHLSSGEDATLSMPIVNESTQEITALQVSLNVKQWSAVANGAADRISAQLVTSTQTHPLPDLGFIADQTSDGSGLPDASPTTLTAIAQDLRILPGESFQLQIQFLADTEGGTLSSDIFINEFHYDNNGADTGEFVEVAVGPGFVGDLSDVDLILYNGSNGGIYDTHSLTSFQIGETSSSGHRIYHKAISGIQNGSPDGMALAHGGNLIEFISYEGSFVAAEGPAAGQSSVDIGIQQSGSDTPGTAALSLTGTGAFRSEFSWQYLRGEAHSPGLENAEQTFVATGSAPQGLGIDRVEVVSLTDHDFDGIPDIADLDDDNDGQSDIDELAFGTNPLDREDIFKPQITWTGSVGTIAFPTASGSIYQLESSTDLLSWQVVTTTHGNGQAVENPLPPVSPRIFYRIKASRNPTEP